MTEAALARRGTSNGNQRGSSEDRRRRREWLVATYASDVQLTQVLFVSGHVDVYPYGATVEELEADPVVVRAEVVPTCRCYRCGELLTVDTVTVDRIIPGCHGGTYRRDNIRPACGKCNSSTGAPLRRKRRR